jgi:hypothetical protein
MNFDVEKPLRTERLLPLWADFWRLPR